MAFRTRIALALISVAVIGLEISLMRVLALRFWHYFAAMVISVALLGFGSSGTALTLLQTRLKPKRLFWMALSGFGSALSILLCARGVQLIPLNVHFLAWNLPAEMLHILAIECLLLMPFFFTGAFIGLALMDRPERIHSHYGTNLAASGIGAFLVLVLMLHLTTIDLLVLWAMLCFAAGLFLINRRDSKSILAGAVTGIVLAVAVCTMPPDVAVSPYKKLAMEKSKPGTEVVHSTEGPLSRIDVIEGPAIHDAPPGLSLQNPQPIPKRSLLIVDGDRTHIVYHTQKKEDWRFLDQTTTALPFALGRQSRVLVIGSGGGAPLALSRQHASEEIVALESNRQMVELMLKRYAQEQSGAYRFPGVRVYFEEPRSFLRRPEARYDLILIPLLEAAGGGFRATQENYLYTLEAFRGFLRRLKEPGLLCVTVYSQTPPRDGLRLFNLAREALDREGITARDSLAMIRSWETVTLLAAKKPLNPQQLQKIRDFSNQRGFDMCYLPDLSFEEANRFHLLPEPDYFKGAKTLLGSDRSAFVRDYLFALSVPTDDRPYFDNFLRWNRLQDMKKQLKGQMPAFMELGALLSAAALLQAAVLAAVLILLPLAPRAPGLKFVPRKLGVLLYFLLIGGGFMLLEMSLLQKMILYLGHPIYSAAVVIAAFLIFGGLGSLASEHGFRHPAATVLTAGLLTATLAGLYLVFLDPWLEWSQSRSLVTRFWVVSATLAPLAFAMGHMFPTALRLVSETFPALVPWCWAANGFASVLAAAAAPLAAMSLGFSRLILIAIGCYLLAVILFLLRHRQSNSACSPLS